MTESDWLRSNDPDALLEHLGERATRRKRMLLACACCRRVPGFLGSPKDRLGLELAERDADGEEIASASYPDHDVWDMRWYRRDEYNAYRRAVSAYWDTLCHAEGAVVGGPESAVERVKARFGADLAALVREMFAPPVPLAPLAWPGWEAVIPDLAAAAYEQRWPVGELDPARLAVLADALEDAGRAGDALLDHLHAPGPHYRGCWALDLILGKE